MFYTISLILFYILTPVLLIYLSEKINFFKKIGVVLLAYAIGLFVGNINIIDNINNNSVIQEIINNITIPLAIPLLLFSLDVKSWFKSSGKVVIALFVLLFSVIISVIIGYFLFKRDLTELWKISGMLMGVYSGGTPNLASIKVMLDVSPELFVTINTLDMIASSIYLLFLMTIGKKIFRKILPKHRSELNLNIVNYEDETNYIGIFNRKNILPLLKALGYSAIIVVISISLSFLITKDISMLILMLSITTLSILASTNKHINKIKYTFQAGMYFIVIFSIVVASMANITKLSVGAGVIMKYITFVIFTSLLIKTILSKIFKIDADTLIVSSTALICSPPFVPMMSSVLKNKQIIVTGLTIGIIGYAVGNYLGVLIAYLLKLFP
jgi:uncharacterized membrane protein